MAHPATGKFFYASRDNATGLERSCKSCRETQARQRQALDPANERARRKAKHLKRMGLTVAQYQAKRDAQNGRCAGCGSDSPLEIDHAHECCAGNESCGKCVRDLLCGPCNRTLGQSGDDIERLRQLVAYLERWGY